MFDHGGEDIGAAYLGTRGEFMLNANRVNGQANLQLAARGGIALLGGHARATRRLDRSFAMVEVPVSQAIDIYANHVKVGQTGTDGVGFIPRLIPYEVNTVSLDDAGLPLSISLDMAQKSLDPDPRSGSLVKFSARKNQSATLILTDEFGKPLAIGTRVRVDGSIAEQEVALRGLVFIPEIDYPATVVVLDGDAHPRCRFTIPATPQAELFPVLGPFACTQEDE
ncbi:fimbria/pilus outer membrane usher protein [Massilia cavernae]|uniref:PapC-like C-terminal domain-containing protein n=1 Tax=Massilia cavernae TaxID=2320864 RepID=A0A418Y7C0_9BURK|nr:fimbria/pilus outer membrane usher protein [Massilia cavernae]RJG25867.1 hypothetical protein D3872_02345 [Massilia cavernae]